MASEEFKEGSEQKRPNVQVGDPFMEKLLLEACLEAMQTGAVVGIQDMGAAGLTSSSCEMGGRGGVGIEMDLDHVPQRETGMTAYEMMLSESQERMLLVAEKGREQEVLRVFDKWGLEGVIVGRVIEEPQLRILHHGELVADIPNRSLTDECPLYNRPVGTWARPEQIKVPLDPPEHVLAELQKPRDYTADLKKLLASANICSKRWVYEQYDSMVQTNTVQGPGGEAGVMRIKGSGSPGHERGLAMALAGNGRWCYLDPRLGAMHAVAEAARKVACTGATPVAATNCLNFGNPEKPEIMAQLSAAIDGIAEACTALGTPITGGNVSLYNETRSEGIYPTPVVGVVGLIEDVTKAVPSGFHPAGDAVVLLMGAVSLAEKKREEIAIELGSTEFGKNLANNFWGKPSPLDLRDEAALHRLLKLCANEGLIHSAADISDGGLAVTLARAAIASGTGVTLLPSGVSDELRVLWDLYGEPSSGVIVTCTGDDLGRIEELIDREAPSIFAMHIGETGGDRLIIPFEQGGVDASVAELQNAFSGALESQLAEEVTA
jgi:phosphoribosylformylglycinamidine synthase